MKAVTAAADNYRISEVRDGEPSQASLLQAGTSWVYVQGQTSCCTAAVRTDWLVNAAGVCFVQTRYPCFCVALLFAMYVVLFFRYLSRMLRFKRTKLSETSSRCAPTNERNKGKGAQLL